MKRRHRTLDVVLCLLALPILVPFMLIIALATWLDSPGPAIYRAHRIGLHGEPFEMLKFRTMGHGLPGASVTSSCDDRITPLGRWLRRHRLDELPQIFNVVRGEMCLVGPRPEAAEFVDAYPEHYATILTVRPGVTGPTQLIYVDEESRLAGALDRAAVYRDTILPGKIQSDLGYVARPSLRSDLLLLCRTGLLPVGRLRAGAFSAAVEQQTAATSTRSAVLVSLLSAALVGLFATDLTLR